MKTTRQYEFVRSTGETSEGAAVGQAFGQCVLEHKLGEGAMGIVFRAHHLTLNRKVAVKVLRQDLPKEFQARRRFLREARAEASLDHPNIVAVHDAGAQNGVEYIVMQYIDGETLGQRLRDKRRMPRKETLRIVRETLRALCHAHAHGVVHRDVKPDNILLGNDGSVKLADFGFARVLGGDPNVSMAGQIVGSPTYMSPEQALGQTVDGRTDLYSLGATLYRITTGVPPFRSKSPVDVVSRIVRDPLTPPKTINPLIPRYLSKYICQLMRKDRQKRLASAKQALQLLIRLERSHEARRGTTSGILSAFARVIGADRH